MKRAVAAVVLLLALGALVKLARFTPGPTSVVEAPAPISHNDPAGLNAQADAEALVLAKYPDHAELLTRVLERYKRTALTVEAEHGLRGLRLLDRLDLDAIFLFEKHPDEFRRLASALNDAAAADLLLHWREYFGLKRGDDVDRRRLVEEIAKLSPSRRAYAARYPSALPLILSEPVGVCDLMRRLRDQPDELNDALAMLDLISLAEGPDSLRRALITIENDRTLALDAFRQLGPEGFALVTLYAPVLRALGDGSIPLDQALILLRVNTDDVDDMLRTRPPEFIAGQLRHVASLGLVEPVGSSPHGLRLSVEYGALGDRALEAAGADAADVVYSEYDDALLRQQAVAALAAYGPMAALILTKYAADPDFRQILARDGAPIISPIARADAGPEVLLMLQSKARKSFSENLAEQVLNLSGQNGQAAIRLIRDDGLARAAELDRADVRFEQFLPLYDLLHLGNVMARGHAPTAGEMTWALIDGCLVVMDVVSLAALQPAATAATEAARTEVKATVRTAAKAAGRELAEETVESLGTAATRTARWWAVRTAGGTYRVLQKLPEALSKMSLTQVARSATPFSAKAGLRLSTWTPIRLMKDGASTLLRVPTGRWTKYVGINIAQAGVGIAAMHKMEEWMGAGRSEAQ